MNLEWNELISLLKSAVKGENKLRIENSIIDSIQLINDISGQSEYLSIRYNESYLENIFYDPDLLQENRNCFISAEVSNGLVIISADISNVEIVTYKEIPVNLLEADPKEK